jgi:hypothetical protein
MSTSKAGEKYFDSQIAKEVREVIYIEMTLNGIVQMAGIKGNLIPSNYSLKTWIQKYYRVIRSKGISKKECGASSHGCRHAYAQDRYEEITGFKAPCKFETKEKYRKNAIKIAGEGWRKLNQDARQIIKAELGHGPDRDDVVSQYLGAI